MTLSDAPAKHTISVALGDGRAYDVHVGAGLLDAAGGALSPLLKRPRTVIVTDENVATTQGERLRGSLAQAGIAHDEIVLPAGESTKSFAHLQDLCERLLALGVERSDLIIAFGGGVIGDLTGLAAGLLRRGCRFAQIPTTLLAQVDSSVGGKTAINTRQGKNLVGLFYQPDIVIADIDALDTLSPRERRAGYAEVAKYAAINDGAFFYWLETDGANVIAGSKAARVRAVATSVQAKADIVAADEREQNVRQLLNLGHTFGHALEAAAGYSSELLHGEAVAAGMGLAFDFSVAEGLCPAADAARLKAHLKDAGLPSGLDDLPSPCSADAAGLLDLMFQDKKVKAGRLTLILARGIGRAFVAEDVAPEKIERFLQTSGAG